MRRNLPTAGIYAQRAAQARGLVGDDQSLCNRTVQLESELQEAHKDLALTQDMLQKKVDKLVAASLAVAQKATGSK